MRLASITYVGAVAWLVAMSVQSVDAQPQSFGNRPLTLGYRPPSALSPYLNLLQPGNTGINYYGLVRPQQQFNSALSTMQGEITNNQQAISGLQDPNAIRDTGHSTRFMNLGNYFMNTSGSPNAAGSQTANRPVGGTGGTATRAPVRPARGGMGR